jgi:outer membrane lipoprotein-sorting protein
MLPPLLCFATWRCHIGSMNRRTLLALLTLLPVAAQAQTPPAHRFVPTARDQADIARVEAYLNTLRSFRARFLQVAPDGTTSEGNAWLERPGRLRFEYDKPNADLLVAGFGSAVWFDAQLKQTTSVPLATTPLGILLSDTIRLSGDVTVTGINREPGELDIAMVRTRSPGDGSLTLVFNDQPLALRQWAVTDQQHQETRVSLFNLQPGGDFAASLFQFQDPRLREPGQGQGH